MGTKRLHIAEITCDKIFSENILYHQNITRGGKRYVYKNPVVRKFQEDIEEGLEASDLRDLSKYNYEYLEIEFLFFVRKKRFKNMDVTNCVKAVEDSLVKITGIDDSRHVKVSSTKIQTEEDYEHIYISVRGLTGDELEKEFKYLKGKSHV